MIIRKSVLSSAYRERFPDSFRENSVFYDIETTGLGWRSSHIYLIGALFQTDGVWTLRQWFLERPFAEKEMLQDFSVFLSERPDSVLTDYNGDTFDLPYLRHKYEFYNMDVPGPLTQSGASCHVDLLRLLRPLKSRLPLTSLRLQDVEKVLHTGRKDASSGKDLIETYYDYLKTADLSLLEQLFLHNYDDVAGLTAVASLLSFSAFWDGRFTVNAAEDHDDSALIELLPSAGFPLTYSLESSHVSCGSCLLSFQPERALLQLPVIRGERKLFFPDPKNYFYLPDEDSAVHKSVGIYIDSAHRTQAKASTCYQRVQDRFLPCSGDPGCTGTPRFYEAYRDKTAWFRLRDIQELSQQELHDYVLTVIKGYF